MGASNFQAKVDSAIEAVRGRTVPGNLNAASLGAMGVGAAAVGYGFVSDPVWTWGALLVALFYGLLVSQGAVMYSVIMHGTLARWGRPFKRIGESFAFALPVIWVLFAIWLVAGGMTIYEWHPDWVGGEPVSLAPHGEGAAASKPFLFGNPWFFVARVLVSSGILTVLSLVLARNSLKPDLIMAKKVLGADAPSWWSNITGGADGDVGEAAAKAEKANYVLVPIFAISYALFMSFLAFDLLMSLDVWWFSNMFGGWVFMSGILLGLAVIAVVGTTGLEWLSLEAWIPRSVTHDLGKLMLAGTMFWAYTLFAQLLPIYYTDVPEETNFLLVRMFLPQWAWLARTVAVMCFVAPFTILLSRGIKKMRWPFVAVATVILIGQFLNYTLIVMPSVHRGDAFPTVTFLIVGVGAVAFVVGVLMQVVNRVLASVPAVPISDPLLEDHPWDVHVHGEAHAH